MARIAHPFRPIVGQGAKVLILGTMPSVASLEKSFYYAHPQNSFWRIIYALFGQEPDERFCMRSKFLISKRIALWDVLSSCEREGSLDSAISSPVPNDINGLLRNYPTIAKIFFNGNNACVFYKRLLGRPSLPYGVLPSTSPANASLTFDQKLERWREILKVLNF